MSAKSMVRLIGKASVGLYVIMVLPVLFIVGGYVVGEELMALLCILSALTLVANIVILTPLALISATRYWAGLGFLLSSYLFGLTGWFLGLVMAWDLWGQMAVIIGLLLAGVGVVPLGMLALLFNGMWGGLVFLVFVVALTFVVRFLGTALTKERSS